MTRSGFLAAGPLPAAERLILLCWALGSDRAEVYRRPHEPVPAAAAVRLDAAVRRRAAGWPLQYVTGEAWFWSHKLRVGPGVLVPRPETETLVDAALERLQGGGRVADIGTGSGAIALALAGERPDLEVTAVERSPRALRYARQNLGPEVRLLRGDLLQPLTAPQDVIVSNPPYVSAAEYGDLAPDVRREPRTALVGGRDGLSVLRRLARGAGQHLRPGGWLLVEIGAGQGEAVQEIFAAEGFGDIFLRTDLAGLARVVGGRLG